MKFTQKETGKSREGPLCHVTHPYSAPESLLSQHSRSPTMATLITLQTHSQPPHKMTKLPPKILASTSTTRPRYPLKQGQSRLFHRLPSGLQMEVISQKPLKQPDSAPNPNPNPNPPLVFVHGSFHAAWCWAEHWMPFFSGYGYDCYAVSLLGQVFLRFSPFLFLKLQFWSVYFAQKYI